jgi:hypothetical protein
MVTSSSAAVGCTATQLSKSVFVAPIFIASAKPCSASSQPMPVAQRKTSESRLFQDTDRAIANSVY